MTECTFEVVRHRESEYNTGIFLYFGDDVRVKIAEDLNSLKDFQKQIDNIVKEIEENYYQ